MYISRKTQLLFKHSICLKTPVLEKPEKKTENHEDRFKEVSCATKRLKTILPLFRPHPNIQRARKGYSLTSKPLNFPDFRDFQKNLLELISLNIF